MIAVGNKGDADEPSHKKAEVYLFPQRKYNWEEIEDFPTAEGYHNLISVFKLFQFGLGRQN